MSVPQWWSATLLALATFRCVRLVGWDDLTASWRLWVRRRLGKGAETFVSCPWCVGWWITLGWWAAWQIWPHGTLVAAVPFALAAVVGLVAKGLDP